MSSTTFLCHKFRKLQIYDSGCGGGGFGGGVMCGVRGEV